MSPEEKQALIEHAKSWIADAEAARDEIPFGFDEDTEMELSLIKIALAALTAQPVKLPKKEKALIGRDYLYVYCAGPIESAIRDAGHEVQE